MGHSISEATHQRIERHRSEDRLCQGSGRCSTRATYAVAWNTATPGSHTSPDGLNTFVLCRKHAMELLDSFKHFGFLFDNDRDAEILAVVKFGPHELGFLARLRAVEKARRSDEWRLIQEGERR